MAEVTIPAGIPPEQFVDKSGGDLPKNPHDTIENPQEVIETIRLQDSMRGQDSAAVNNLADTISTLWARRTSNEISNVEFTNLINEFKTNTLDQLNGFDESTANVTEDILVFLLHRSSNL